MAYQRTGLALNTDGRNKLLELSKAAGIGQSPLIECVLFALTSAEAKALVERGRPLRDASVKRDKELRKAARKQIKGMSTEALEAMLGIKTNA